MYEICTRTYDCNRLDKRAWTKVTLTYITIRHMYYTATDNTGNFRRGN
jgi:hypothetical protein